MKKFDEYILARFNEDLGSAVNAPPEDPVSPGMTGEVGELQVQSMIRKRLQMLFDELQGHNVSRPKAIEMLAIILREFQTEFNLNTSSIRQAVRKATIEPTGLAQSDAN